MEFPLLAWSATLRDNHFMLLDESQIPEKVEYITIHNYQEGVDAITSMKTRAFGQLLTMFYSLILTLRQSNSQSVYEDLSTASEAIVNSRPTFAFGKYAKMVKNWLKEAKDANEGDVRIRTEEKIIEFLNTIKKLRISRVEMAASLINDGDTILTHCNMSGELLMTAQVCKTQGKHLKFFATETRPYFQGRLTAWELSQSGFDVTLVPDNQVASLMSKNIISKVITGADRVALNGDIVNKSGTCQIALCANHFGIPFYSFVQEPGTVAEGKEIPIEIRPDEEICQFRNIHIYPEFIKGYYPAFDITPHSLITKLITFNKIISPQNLPEGWYCR